MQERGPAARCLVGGLIVVSCIHQLLWPRAALGACVAPPSGLIGWWAGNGNANDSAGANSGTLQNSASFGPGLAGQALSLNGNGGFVQAPPRPAWALGTNRLSIALWAHLAAPRS